jgi:hypothetical protein
MANKRKVLWKLFSIEHNEHQYTFFDLVFEVVVVAAYDICSISCSLFIYHVANLFKLLRNSETYCKELKEKEGFIDRLHQ